MPNNWKTYKLGDIADIQNGYAFKATELVNSGIPVIKIKNIISPNVSIEDVSYYNRELTDNLKKYIIEKGDFLISMTGSTVNVMSSAVGKMGRYRLDDKSLINQRVGKIYLTKPDIASFEYVCQYLNRYEIHYNLALNATGSANQANISPAQIKDIEILLPTLQEQKSIAQILSTIDDKIENNLAINKTLEEMAMTLYKHWFVDFGPFQDGEFVESELGRIPKGWEVKRLDELADFINGYAFKSGELKNDNDGNSYHIFKMGHIERGGGLKENATKSYINKSKCEKLEKYILKVGDLLMAMTDMKDNVAILGNTALINENDKYIVNQRVGLIRPNNDIGIDYSFLYLITNENSFIERLRSQANSGVQVNLSTDAIKSAKMVIGSKEINLNFDDIVKPLYDNIFQNKIENQTLTQLRDTLLPKLISGEVRLKKFKESITN